MIFSTYVFWCFFAIVVSLYFMLSHRWQNRMLLVASWVFYGWWDVRFLLMMFGTTVVDYYLAQRIEDSADRRVQKRWLMVSVVMNLGLLAFFKYCNFFIENTHAMLQAIGFQPNPWTLQVILPVGISFYTFQEMSYCIDVYRGELKASRKFSDFALFVAFFPQLVAGPIERATKLLPQVQRPRVLKEGTFTAGLYLVMLGLFKKIIIADNMAQIADWVFTSDVNTLTGPECLLGIYAFAFQIYGDFSGYSCIAQGVAKWLGFELMDNFRMPYFATSPSDFWRRWHISLSQWLRDYLYIPLGGNRGSSWKTYRNLILTMLLGGLWHGAAWTFVLWGLFHGVLLAAWRWVNEPEPGQKLEPEEQPSLLYRLPMMVLMFHLVCVGWLLFRAESASQAWTMASLLFTNFDVTPFVSVYARVMAFFITPLLLLEFWIYMQDDLLALTRAYWLRRAAVYSYCAAMLLCFAPEIAHEFIYFQF
ncbi:MAG TPA: MBOAT family O-acyltransferase [Planctomycetota bacterium]|nr:MBOAT family O-acyltransferase [Planctomycetota bacterium]